MRIQASEIEGLEKYGSGQIWWPDIPTIQPVGSRPGITNNITTISISKQNSLKTLEFKAPLNITTIEGINLVKGKYYITEQLNDSLPFELTEQNTNYPFATVVYYNFYKNAIQIEQGLANATVPIIPAIPATDVANSIIIGVHIEPKAGDPTLPPIVPSQLNYFEVDNVHVSSILDYTLDFKYSQINIYVTGSITLTIYPPSYYSGQSIPYGKTIILRIHVLSGTPTISFDGASFKYSNSYTPISNNSSEVNVFTVSHWANNGDTQYQLDNLVYEA